MVEIKFKGRGGQGAVIASQTLAKVYFLSGNYVQCFSVFGGERRGAPVASFLRVDDRKILLKCEIQKPDQLIYMAPDMVDEQEIASTLKPGGTILINNSLTSNDFKSLRPYNFALIDALSVAEEVGLGAMIKTAILGAYARATNSIPMEFLEQAITETVPAKIPANIAAARLAFEITQVFQRV